MGRRKKNRDLPPNEVRRIEPGQAAHPEAERAAGEELLLEDEHDGWQPVRPRRSSAPPDP